MEMTLPATMIRLGEASQVGEARRAASRMADHLALSHDRSNSAALIATELATNLLKHSTDGLMILQPLFHGRGHTLRMLAIDKGPGITDMTSALRDGYSTTTTMGGGLGAMRRMSDGFDIFSQVGTGTVVMCDFGEKNSAGFTSDGVEWGMVTAPYRGEEANGDGHAVRSTADQSIFMVVDGLGHGILASEAAREAERVVLESASYAPAMLIRDSHAALAKTRGAAIALASLNRTSGLLLFGGVGNIAGSLSTSRASRGLASHNGTVGHSMQKVQEFSYPWEKDALLLVHSDGISGRWDLDKYPGLRSKHPAVVAAVIYRDFGRPHDDCTVLVARNRQESE
jgi:anti-sigma regulatory factor (Ser/Thr protein kinase)